MSCNCNNRYRKSVLETCSNTPVTIDPTVVGGVPAVFNTTPTDTGCSINGQTGGAQIRNGGLFEFSFDTFVTSAAAGTVRVQLYKDGVPLPCAQDSVTLAAGATGNMHFSTRIEVACCCAVNPVFTVVFTSTDITALVVNHTALGVVKLA